LALRLRDRGFVVWHRRDLIRLGEFFGTDKWGSHWYLQHYEKHFSHLRLRRLNILEIGIGGYDQPRIGGESLRMWKAYFPNSDIFGIDIYDKSALEERRIKTFRGSQTHEAFLRDVVSHSGGFDIIIDDGSHVNEHVIKSFELLFPLMREDGIYVVEDTQTSYWPGFGGSSLHTGDKRTTMGYFTALVHSLNHQELLPDSPSRTQFDGEIVAMHFYHNLVFIYKGDNSEPSNVSIQNEAHAREMLGEGVQPITVSVDSDRA
jgi:demethylmacrocin O-methyltransferase